MFKIEPSILKKYAGRQVGTALKTNNTLSELFHENTKLSPMTSRAYGMRIGHFSHNPIMQRLAAVPFKVYSLMDRQGLYTDPPQTPIEECIATRRSVREYTGEPMTRRELGRLLRFTYGRTEPNNGWRPVASGGALYPLELYVVAVHVDGLQPGIYHYDVENHFLDVLDRDPRLDELKEYVYFDTVDVDQAAVMIVVTAVFARSTIKYQDRGYRLILLEAGQVGHNLCLLAHGMGYGGCLIGGFQDDLLSGVLGINGVDEAPLLPVVIGKPNPASCHHEA